MPTKNWIRLSRALSGLLCHEGAFNSIRLLPGRQLCQSENLCHGARASSLSAVGQKPLQEPVSVSSAVPVGSHSTKVIFSNHQTCDFKFIWLRDNCGCSVCVHPETKQKLLDTPSLDVNIRPKSLLVSAGGELLVEWPEDGSRPSHSSVYSPRWLHKHGQCFAQDSFEVANESSGIRPPIELWDRTTIWNRFPEISHREVMGSDEGLKTWLEMIHKYGLAIIRGVPVKHDEIVNVVNRFAYVKETSYGLTFDVVSEPDPGAHLANTGMRLELHTDMNYREKSPGLQLLHCLKASKPTRDEQDGGKSFFVDGFFAAKWLQENQPSAFHVLSSTPIRFSIVTKNLKYSQHWPIICVDKDSDVTEIHLNNRTMGPLQAPSHLVMAFYHAYKLFTEKLRSASLELVFQLAPGDLVAFNNRRVLHGRSSFDPRYVHRHLKGCYVDIDEALSRYDHLLSK